MPWQKGSYKNPNEGYEMGIYKGSAKIPPAEEPAYEIEASVLKGSIRQPPEDGPQGIEATVIKGSVRKPPVSERTITYN